MSSNDSLARLAAIIESRKPANGGDPDTSYVARLLERGPDAFLKKIGEEATEAVMAAKDAEHGGDRQKLVNEVADLWFHTHDRPGTLRAEARRRDRRAGAPRGHERHRGEGACARRRAASATQTEARRWPKPISRSSRPRPPMTGR